MAESKRKSKNSRESSNPEAETRERTTVAETGGRTTSEGTTTTTTTSKKPPAAALLFRPFPTDHDSLTTNLWWNEPCRNLTTCVQGDKRDVRRTMMQLTTALADHHVKAIMEDYKFEVLMGEVFDFDVSYSFFPEIPTESDDEHFHSLGISEFYKETLELLECFAMLTEQVICDQQSHHPRFVPPLIAMQRRNRELLCTVARTMSVESVQPKQTIQRFLVPASFRSDTALEACDLKIYAVLREFGRALRYASKGMTYWDRLTAAEERGGGPGRRGSVERNKGIKE